MSLFVSTPIRFALMLLISALLVSGCSSSSDSNSAGSQSLDEMEDATTENATSGSLDESTNGLGESTTGSDTETGSEDPSTTRVNFEITVPVIFSDALQVRLVWGDMDTTAMWNNGQFWTASVDLPVNTTKTLVVTFSDGNGAITLGSFESSFRTSTNQSESVQITADEFDIDRWDSDGDGVSNISESIAGTNPLGSEPLEPVQAVLEFVADKTFRISWQSSTAAQFYRVLENPDGISGFTDISGELDATTTDFDHRVALFARVNAHYLVQSCSALGCVDSDELMATGTLANAIGYFKASNTDVTDYLGKSVSLSADGNTLAIGASGEDSAAVGINGNQSDNSANNAGAVYVFVRSGEQWQQQAYLKSSNADAGAGFGSSLILSADGNTLAIGAFGEDSAAAGINGNQSDNSANNAGAVYVFVRSGEQWQQQAYLKASNTDAGDYFGRSLSLSADGDTLAVGALYEQSGATGINGDQSDNSVYNAGAVYVFVRSGGQWQQQAYLKASNTGFTDWFGYSVNLNANGDTLAIGAAREDSAATGINGDQSDGMSHAGAVYVFVRSDEQWQQQAYLKASNTAFENSFGFSLGLSADGNTLVVGASGEHSSATGINGDQNDLLARYSGAAYVFVRSAGLWQQQAYLKASNTDADDRFGFSLSLSADGNTLAVGAIREDSAATGINGDQSGNSRANFGAVYVFVRRGGLWQQQAYLKASDTGVRDFFGSSLSLSADGNTLAIGADGEGSGATGINGDQTDNSIGGSGAVYLF